MSRLAAWLPQLPGDSERIGSTVLIVALVLAVTLLLARLAARAVHRSTLGGRLPGVSLLANIARMLVFAIGILVVLQTVGISITPIVTALGVGGLAVGLALQDTLANFFAGIRILVSRKIRPGDFIRLESGHEGFVEDITWAQTTLRQAANNLVIVPNAKLAQAITTNFSLPTPPQTVTVEVGVAYHSDLARVERVALEVANEVQRDLAPQAVTGFEPAVRFKAFAESSVGLNVLVRAANWDERGIMQHELIKRLLARFRAEGIEIPFPVRTLLQREPRS